MSASSEETNTEGGRPSATPPPRRTGKEIAAAAGNERCELVIDLSMKKRTNVFDVTGGAGDAVKVELIPSAFDVKISELLINADKKSCEVSEGGAADTIELKVLTPAPARRAKKRKQPPQKIIQGCKESGYVTEPAEQQEAMITEQVVVAPDASAMISSSTTSNGTTTALNGQSVFVETVLEVETNSRKLVTEEEASTLPLNVSTGTSGVSTTTSSSSSSSSSTTTSVSVTASFASRSAAATSLLNSSILGSGCKSMRPFKLYTQNRDLLAGIGLDQNNINNLTAALSGRPLVSPSIVGSTASLPIAAFAPLNVKSNPLIPTTIPSGVPEATASQVGSTAGNSGVLLSAETSVITSTSTSSAMRLMTLATEADKILKEKKQDNYSSAASCINNSTSATKTDSSENISSLNVPIIITSSDTNMGHVNDDGTIELTLDATSPERLALIQRQIAETPQYSDTEHQSKKNDKKRQQLPDTMKTPNYWERRRKNNEAAKRSRDARRAKEDQIAIRAAILEHENTRLKIELKALKEETALLRAEIYERKKSDPK